MIAASDAPAGAVAPVDEVAEARVRRAVVELLDPEHLRRGPGGRVENARPRSFASTVLETVIAAVPGEAGDDALADRASELVVELHDDHHLLCLDPGHRAPSRSIRWSPTRSAFAIAVSAGFTALDDGKKLVSTTYRLSRSCALQSTSSADVGRVVAEAHGAALVRDAGERDARVADQLVRDAASVTAEGAEQALELRDQPPVRPRCCGRCRRGGSALRSTVTRLSACGRSSEVSQKSIAWRAM